MKVEKKKNAFYGIISMGTLFLVLTMRIVWAAPTLSVTPYEGDYDLRFGKISLVGERINRELRVRVTSDISKQYRILQVVSSPLSTDDGYVFPQKNFLVYGLRGTNTFGTLHVEQAFPVGTARQILYTSNTAGASDNFTLVYSLIPPEEVRPGSYRGRISFVFQPIDSTQELVTQTINVFAEVSITSSVTIATPTGSRSIRLKSDRDVEDDSNKVLVSIPAGMGKQFRIIQSVSEQLVSAEGNRLSWQGVNFIGRGAQKGMLVSEATVLSPRQQIVYTSSARGDADAFEIEYLLGDLSGEKEGRYRANLKFYLEGPDGQVRLLETIGLEVEHPRLFELLIAPESKRGVIRFDSLKPKDPPKTNEVTVEIKTNLGRRYQVTQNVYSDLINKQGNVIPQGFFVVRTEGFDTKGTLRLISGEPVRKGDTVLFISDEKGSSDKFKVVYELTIPRDVPAGDYSTQITYSWSEI